MVGDGFSVADLTAASILANIVRPDGYPYPWTEVTAPFAEMAGRYADHPATHWVRRTHAEHRSPSMEGGAS